MEEIKIGGRYTHFKGHIIQVICVARHTETEEEMVVYEEITGPGGKDNPKGKYWVRPKKMFLEKVVRDGKEMQRFTSLDVVPAKAGIQKLKRLDPESSSG